MIDIGNRAVLGTQLEHAPPHFIVNCIEVLVFDVLKSSIVHDEKLDRYVISVKWSIISL